MPNQDSKMVIKRDAQLSISFPRKGGKRIFLHGGAREGAGRPRNPGRKLMSHTTRVAYRAGSPCHVTLRVVSAVGNLRNKKRFVRIRAALAKAKERLDMRIVHFSVLHDHIHLIVEARKQPILSRGMQG